MITVADGAGKVIIVAPTPACPTTPVWAPVPGHTVHPDSVQSVYGVRLSGPEDASMRLWFHQPG